MGATSPADGEGDKDDTRPAEGDGVMANAAAAVAEGDRDDNAAAAVAEGDRAVAAEIGSEVSNSELLLLWLLLLLLMLKFITLFLPFASELSVFSE